MEMKLYFDLLDTQAGKDIYQQGIIIGQNKSSRKIAKRMLLENLSITEIAKYTSLSEQEITALKAEI